MVVNSERVSFASRSGCIVASPGIAFSRVTILWSDSRRSDG